MNSAEFKQVDPDLRQKLKAGLDAVSNVISDDPTICFVLTVARATPTGHVLDCGGNVSDEGMQLMLLDASTLIAAVGGVDGQ